jgi:hypothetical protein
MDQMCIPVLFSVVDPNSKEFERFSQIQIQVKKNLDLDTDSDLETVFYPLKKKQLLFSIGKNSFCCTGSKTHEST